MTKTNYQKQKGFTLIELLVVMAILGILATIGLGAYLTGQVKARDSRRKNDLQAVTSALEAYYNDHQSYPTGDMGKIKACFSSGTQVGCEWGAEMIDNNTTSYMVQLPDDPKSGWNYCYMTTDAGQSYHLLARLENTQDKAIVQVGGAPGMYDVGGNCGVSTVNYNYAVNSSNADQLPSQAE